MCETNINYTYTQILYIRMGEKKNIMTVNEANVGKWVYKLYIFVPHKQGLETQTIIQSLYESEKYEW